MKEILCLIKPRLWSFKNSNSSEKATGHKIRLLLFGTVGFLFWSGTFFLFYRILKYFKAVEGFGDILAAKLLSMVIVTFFSLLVFSSIITVLSKLYLSHDLQLVHSLPVSTGKVFLSRWLESTADSSWMVIIFSMPIFLSYGIVYHTGFSFFFIIVMTMLPLCLIASALSTITILITAVIMPAGRIRVVFILFGIILFLLLIMTLRMMRPERLVNPETFSTLVLYFKSMETPGSALLPTTWIIDVIRTSLNGYEGAWRSILFDMALIWSCAASLVFIATWTAGSLYFPGFSRSQTTSGRFFRSRIRKNKQETPLFRFLPGPVRAFVMKETKSFLRDQSQWPQVLLIVALIVIYIFNFSVLPLDKSPIKTVYLQNLFAFLNMGLASFVLVAISARFVYPAVSSEGQAFWIVRAAPIPIKTFLWIKFFLYLFPMLILAEILIVVTNILLHVTPFMMILSVITVFCMVPGVISLGIGLGAAYPDFQSENPAQSVTSFGGLLFMILCTGFIGLVIILEAGPVYTIFMAGLRGQSVSLGKWIWVIASFTAAVSLCVAATILPMRFGERKLRAW